MVEILVVLGDPRVPAAWAQTSRHNYALANDPLVWRRLCEVRFGPVLHRLFDKSLKGWRWLYRAQARAPASTGVDTGAVLVHAHGSDYAYWGDCLDGLPHGYGLGLLLPTLHAAPEVSPVRIKCRDANDAPPAAAVGYEGEWHQGAIHGRGFLTTADGSRYTGEVRDGKPNGHGTLTSTSGYHREGQWKGGQAHGHGTCTYYGKDHYEGQWEDGAKRGYGTYTWANGNRYQGAFRGDTMSGFGTSTYVDGSRFDGQHAGGRRCGYGVYVKADGTRFECEWRDDAPHGDVNISAPSGAHYRGGLVVDGRHGRGVHTNAEGSRYDGQWRDNKRDGTGTWYYTDGSCARGEWLGKTALSAVVVHHRDGNAVCRLGSPCAACTAVAAPPAAPDATRSSSPPGDPQDATAE